ncbi:MAG: DUF805 domain-containing protein [Actinomycetia bacterium]|nr:DUF805 domain-containing protein [Actinomycetes bacterium]MCP5032587.1 DUF805 domain-containing protein [Actinomycetes bacterium]
MLLVFSGQESRRQFWTYALPLVLAGMLFAPILIGSIVVFVLAPGPGFDPGDRVLVVVSGILSAVAVGLFAAAICRRLHDTNRTGLWGLLPIPSLVVGLVLMW